jgi:hypothetical protein
MLIAAARFAAQHEAPADGARFGFPKWDFGLKTTASMARPDPHAGRRSNAPSALRQAAHQLTTVHCATWERSAATCASIRCNYNQNYNGAGNRFLLKDGEVLGCDRSKRASRLVDRLRAGADRARSEGKAIFQSRRAGSPGGRLL